MTDKGITDWELLEKLEIAQDLLSDVYHWACIEKKENIESLMSVADGCICQALGELDQLIRDEFQIVEVTSSP